MVTKRWSNIRHPVLLHTICGECSYSDPSHKDRCTGHHILPQIRQNWGWPVGYLSNRRLYPELRVQKSWAQLLQLSDDQLPLKNCHRFGLWASSSLNFISPNLPALLRCIHLCVCEAYDLWLWNLNWWRDLAAQHWAPYSHSVFLKLAIAYCLQPLHKKVRSDRI